MSVLIGLRCSDGGAFACDSQETRANYFRYWSKVGLIKDRAVVMYSGDPTIGEAFKRRLEGSLLSQGMDKGSICGLIERVLRSFDDGGEDLLFRMIRQILIGCSFDGEILLYAVDAGHLYPREMRDYECYGSGADVAEMLMRDLYFPDIDIKRAIGLLSYVVSVVEEVCIDCGGPIMIVLIDKAGVREVPRRIVYEELGRIKPSLDRVRKELPKRLLRGEAVIPG